MSFEREKPLVRIVMSRETYYLASKYSIDQEKMERCVAMTADTHTIPFDMVADIVYQIDSKVKKVCVQNDIGKRPTNEDTHIFQTLKIKSMGGKVILAGVFDGHAGNEVSKILEEELGAFLELELRRLKSNLPWMVSKRLTESIVKFDENLRLRNLPSGSTLAIVLISSEHVYIVNLGDSRTVVFTPEGKILFETKDHKPDNPEEVKRIVNAGGKIVSIFGVKRVNGYLSLSRAMGDFRDEDKPLGKLYSISNIPDVKYFDRNRPMNILLACDGIWDVMSSKEAVSYISRGCNQIIKRALELRTFDNLTVLLVKT